MGISLELDFIPHRMGEVHPYFFIGKIKVGCPTYFRSENKSCKDLHGIKFIFLFLKATVGV